MEFTGFRVVDIGIIERDPGQPRKIFDSGAIADLSRSIAEVGILQPLLVFRNGDRLRLVAGERRLIAAKMAGLEEVPVVIVDPDPSLRPVISMVENIHRRDLSPLEQAEAISGIMERTGWTQAETGRKIGLSQPSIANKMRLLGLEESVRGLVLGGLLGERHARALLGLPPVSQKDIASKAAAEGLSARAVERLANSLNGRSGGAGESAAAEAQRDAILEDISRAVQRKKQEGLNVTMKVRSSGESGQKLEILVTLQLDKA